MRQIILMLAAAMILGAAAGAIGVRTLGAQQEAEKRTVLVTTDLVDVQGYEVRIWRTDIGPGVVGGKHYHPGTECNYVLEGSLILEKERSEEHTSELQSRLHLVCRLLLEKKKKSKI